MGWLALSRFTEQSVMIGDDIEIKVTAIHGDKVRLCFRAPPDVSIQRREVYDAIRRENIAAARAETKAKP